ncbi:PAS domain-containing protein [Ectothiorhodospira lacustris]|uniref:PAS domain-containing protein n=1 Tax=Ectothiorhodospira lacustris TaxID=2899127 RepID=UPI001EE9956C|nr:PAS domain-containing protein [Ectothiorhodospira lacustris]MCG5499311.1 PAS domain-containing protein [Ectothiorhodospira lacustris]MCG5509200.1 PAS domain-containing protein [Ectothiorhodospira lacustris]MCG5520990.1 PAS domain-containing protein [Ectothiorhodospira lacustris]
MDFIPEKDASGLIPSVLAQILDTCVNGVTLSDPDLPDNPIVYANTVFEHMTGYTRAEIIGHNCRFLQGEDREQPAIEAIRKALTERREVEVTLRNYRKDGTLFHNRLNIRPLFDASGRLIYFLGVQYDVTDLVNARTEVARLEALLRQGASQPG